uniref:Uncharacterized protein n=1 Tax=Sipha flava TaxID=143950 RepID=A0A2S2R0P0_9HEMI
MLLSKALDKCKHYNKIITVKNLQWNILNVLQLLCKFYFYFLQIPIENNYLRLLIYILIIIKKKDNQVIISCINAKCVFRLVFCENFLPHTLQRNVRLPPHSYNQCLLREF